MGFLISTNNQDINDKLLNFYYYLNLDTEMSQYELLC